MGLSRTRCTFCGASVVLGGTGATFDGDAARYFCDDCGRWTRGPPPSR